MLVVKEKDRADTEVNISLGDNGKERTITIVNPD